MESVINLRKFEIDALKVSKNI